MPKPLVTFCFDDGRLSAVTLGARILEEHGARGTFYPIAHHVGTRNEHGPYATWEDLRLAELRGHEIGNHTYSHVREWINWRPAAQSIDIKRANRTAATIGILTVPETFAYPFGLYTDRLKEVVREADDGRFIGARTIDPGINTRETDPFLLASFMVEQKHTLRDVKRELRRAKAQNGWLILTFHHIDSATHLSTPPEMLRDTVRAVQKVAKVVTMREGVQLYRAERKS